MKRISYLIFITMVIVLFQVSSSFALRVTIEKTPSAESEKKEQQRVTKKNTGKNISQDAQKKISNGELRKDKKLHKEFFPNNKKKSKEKLPKR